MKSYPSAADSGFAISRAFSWRTEHQARGLPKINLAVHLDCQCAAR